MKVTLLGIGAVRIDAGGCIVYIDAFNIFNPPPALNPEDLVLFTHDDDDHFAVEPLLKSLRPGTVVIGPPGIAKPLWDTGKVSSGQVRIIYPKEYDKPEVMDRGDLRLTVFNTDHFLNWHAVHTSFLLESEGKRVYITGDSHIQPENAAVLTGLDCLVYSLLNEEIVKGQMDKKWAVDFNLCELLEVQRKYSPRLLMVNHLIGCDWAVDPGQLGTRLTERGAEKILVPVDGDTAYPVP